MPEDKKPEEEEEKKAADLPEDVEKGEAPKWAIELGAKIDKLADAIIRSSSTEKAEKKPEEEEDLEAKKAKEPEKYPYEKEAKKADKYPPPKEEDEEKKKQKDPDKYPPKEEEKKADKKPEEDEETCKKADEDKEPKEEEKGAPLDKMIENAVAVAMAKRFPDEDPIKRSKAIAKGAGAISEEDDMITFHKLTWAEIHELARKAGAP